MAVDDYDNDVRSHRRDIRDAYNSSHLAKWLSMLALLTAAIALAVAIGAANKASDAQGTANRANDNATQLRETRAQ